MVFLIVFHAALVIWASTLATSFLYRVDLSSESVKVNNALEVFGERDMDPSQLMDGSSESSTRQAHVRIGSRTSVNGTSKADEVLEFGTYRGDQFIPKSSLRSEGDGALEVVTTRLSLAPTGGNVGVGTQEPTAKFDVNGGAVIRGNATIGGNNQSSLLKIDSQGTQTTGFQLGPEPTIEASNSSTSRRLLQASNSTNSTTNTSRFNKKSFGVYSLVGGEQVVVKRGNDTVLQFDKNEDTEIAAQNNVVVRAHKGDISLISGNGKIHIHGAITLGGSDLTGTIADSSDTPGAGAFNLLSALSVVNGTVKIASPNIVHEGATVFNGSFTTGNGTIQLGNAWEDDIEFRGTIKGRTAFSFGGAVDDARKISVVVDEPTSAWRTIVLPDASGRFVVSAQAPLSVDSSGGVQLNQSAITRVGALVSGSILPSFGDIDIGSSSLTAGESHVV